MSEQQQVVELLLEQDEISWRTILYDLVRTEQMDPWDINITIITQKYIDLIKKLQEHNLRVSGKILLAAVFLLKIKSSYLLDHDISNLDRLISQTEDADEDMLEIGPDNQKRVKEKYQLIPRNPQPRNRKVSIHDLIDALQKAMATRKTILAKQRPVKFILPKRNVDIMEVIRDLYHKIVYYTEKDQKVELTFSELLPPRAGKMEKVYTFVPLLHLENEQRIETRQNKAFDEIHVKLMKKVKGLSAS